MRDSRSSILTLGARGHVQPPPMSWTATAACLGLFIATLVWAGEPAVVLDAPPSATQKPYSPADGQVVEVTPPPFIWVPAKRAARTSLQVSTSTAFDAHGHAHFDGLRRSVFVPQQPLPPGQVVLALRRRDGPRHRCSAGRGRSRFRTDARPFPFPNWDEVIQRVPQQRPRLFFPGQRLEQVPPLGRAAN